MLRTIAAATAIAAAAFAMTAGPAAAQDRIQVGTLECSLSSSVGLIVGSQRNVNCNFKPNNGPPEMYTGTMTKIGLDIGVTSATAIIWTVFTGTNRYAGMLTGTYTGAQAEATVGAGLGANVWSAARTGRWRCNLCRCRASSGSTSPPASDSWSCTPSNNDWPLRCCAATRRRANRAP